jgi:hypothetical protein
MSPNKIIAQHLNDATDVALIEVERMARKILAEHPNLDEFIMAMGGAFFTVKDRGNGDEPSIEPYERRYMRTLDRFLTQWDSELHLTGIPMRFTATGTIVTSW